MKKVTVLRIFLLFLMVTGAHYTLLSQGAPQLGYFKAAESAGNVHLSWQLLAGSTCNGIQIYRGTDSTEFEQVGEIAGVCGSSSEPRDYTFIDQNPEKNKVNYYRLQFGTAGFSHIVFVEVIGIGNGGYQIRPHPLEGNGRIYFENGSGQLHTLKVFTAQGSQAITLSTQENYFDITTESLLAGIYFFAIYNTDNVPKVKGKLVIEQ